MLKTNKQHKTTERKPTKRKLVQKKTTIDEKDVTPDVKLLASKPLENQAREVFCKLIAQGETRATAYKQSQGKYGITNASAGVGAANWLKDPLTRLRLINLETGTKTLQTAPQAPGKPPDLKTTAGRIKVLEDMIGRNYAGEGKDSEALRAALALVDYYGDVKAVQDERKKPNPAEICHLIFRGAMAGIEPYEAIEGAYGGLDRVAGAACEALGVDWLVFSCGNGRGASDGSPAREISDNQSDTPQPDPTHQTASA